jgi:hypothetical protein
LPTNAAQDGVDGTGITAPTGGSGIRGWLSGIYNKLSNSLTVTASNLDVAVSTRLKPADTLAGVTAVGSITNALPTGTNSIGQVTANAGTNLNTSNLDVALSTRLKPADTLAGVTAVGSITNALPAGTNVIGGVTLPKASTASRSAFTASTDTQIAAASTSRQSISIFNVGPSILYIGFGSTAVSTSDFTYKLNPADTYVANTNEIGLEHRGIFAASGSTANVTIGS